MKSFCKKHPKTLVFLSVSLVCLLLFFLYRISTPFAEWFAAKPGGAVRLALAALTSIFPFSLFEILIGAFVLYLLFLAVWVTVVLIRKRLKNAPLPACFSRLIAAPLAVLLTVFDLYTLTLAPCYYRISCKTHMDLETEAVDREDVFSALEGLLAVVNETAPSLILNGNGESRPSYSLSVIKEKVVEASDAFGERNDFYQTGGFAAKSFLISPIMTYTHISGVYGFFTGEANINTNYPHFIVTATLAHETSHARGIAAENECNFLASVILMESDDPYLRYCGAVFLADDLVSVCRKLDGERTSELLAQCAPVMQKDWAAYSRFFDAYRDSAAAQVADKTNNAYLQSMGQTEGTVSYSRVIRLTSAYFAKKEN